MSANTTMHRDWFGVDVGRRAARIRSRPRAHILKEALSNSLDAGATAISMTCGPEGPGALGFTCTDDGRDCGDPEILRRVGSTTSDLHAGTRGRFGQGLIDLIAVSEWAEIRTLGHRLVFDGDGCRITATKDKVYGLSLTLTLLHGGEGFDRLDEYFDSVILPDGVNLGRPASRSSRPSRKRCWSGGWASSASVEGRARHGTTGSLALTSTRATSGTIR